MDNEIDQIDFRFLRQPSRPNAPEAGGEERKCREKKMGGIRDDLSATPKIIERLSAAAATSYC
jgi:hypothetical protein